MDIATEHRLAPLIAALHQAAQKCKQVHLTQRFVQNPARAQQYQIQLGALWLDYSKNVLDAPLWSLLFQFAEATQLDKHLKLLMHGMYEQEAAEPLASVGHWAARSGYPDNIPTAFWRWLAAWQADIQSGELTDILHVGIGGSELGPKFLCEALESAAVNSVRVHFISNLDPATLQRCFCTLDPKRTRMLMASKSFFTEEVLENHALIQSWFEAHGLPWAERCLAVTAIPERAYAAGFLSDHVISMDPQVTGRYSVWSSMGFIVALKIGKEQHAALVRGACLVDHHVTHAPWEKNISVLLALQSIFYRNFLKIPSECLIPYAHALHNLPSFMQQLSMESNGKTAQLQLGQQPMETSPIIWGYEGTNAQHSFFQWLQQSSDVAPVDFVVVAHAGPQHITQQQKLIAHAIAQAKILMEGTASSELPGNKPSNFLVLKELSPFALGELIAIYEHKIFVQSRVWGVDPFNQPGVELGKRVAKELSLRMEHAQIPEGMDGSTRQIMERISQLQQEATHIG